MPTLNRFPLLGLWAREAARRLGYRKDEAEALGHAYAVLYAIRAQGHKKPKKAKPKPAAPAATPPAAPAEEELEFCGDNLPIQRDVNDHIQGLVGHEEPQTARSYHAHVARKFPPGYYEKLEDAFRTLLKTIPPRELRVDHRLYQIYDQWKKSCGVGRLVDLDKLLQWCEERHTRTPK